MNNRRQSPVACAIALLSAILANAQIARAQGTRGITVTVTAQDQAGTPIPDLPLVLESSLGAVAMGKTDEDGRVVLSGDVPSDDLVAGIRLSGGDLPIFTQAERDTLLGINIVRFLNHCFDANHTLVLPPATSTYDLAVVGRDCVAASLSLENEAGNPITGAACSSIAEPDESRMLPSTSFLLRTPRAMPGFVYVASEERGLLLRLTAAQTAADVSLGALTMSTRTNAGTLTVTTVSLSEMLAAQQNLYFPGFVLVSLDANGFYPLARQFTKNAAGEYVLSAVSAPVPTGTFFVVPTGYLAPPWARGLLDAISAGANLTNSGVARVTIEPGQTVTMNIDVMAAYRALFQLRRYSVQSQNP